MITLACLTTAVGLLTACGEYFSRLLPVSYRTVVIAFALFSLVVANQGLSQLISVSVPVLVGLYPLAIALVALSLMDRLWLRPRYVFVPVMAVTLIFGIADALTAAGWSDRVPEVFKRLPLADQGLGWVVPAWSSSAWRWPSTARACASGPPELDRSAQADHNRHRSEEGFVMFDHTQALIHIVAVLWFIACWAGYSRYANYKARTPRAWRACCTSIERTGRGGCCCATTASPMPT